MKEQKSLKRQLDVTDAQIEIFVTRLERFLGKSLRKILKDLESGKGRDRARAALKIIGSIESELLAAGLNKELEELHRIYGTELRHVEENLADITETKEVINDADIDVTEALVRLDMNLFRGKISTMTDEIASTVMRSVVAGETPNVDELVDKFSGRTVGQIKTEVNTATIAFSRAVTLKKAEDAGLDLFLYVGPDDQVTRPFCKERVGKVFTKAQIEKWDNEQGLPAAQYLGGYNCRHHLRPITLERARQLGYAD